MQASGEAITLEDQFVILLGSLLNDYDIIVKIIENIQGMDLFCVKEMLHREYEGLIRKEEIESALRATRKMYTSGARKQNRNNHGFQGKCFNYGKYGHMKIDCRKNRIVPSDGKAFTCSDGSHGGCILDSGASSHMSPFQDEFAGIRSLGKVVLISVANGVQVEAKGIGTVRVILRN
uniref:Putative polyprotein n=1 Tax=Albugo laibachii Nc14 TaxID=890382 RepID=F0WSG2_9STRA|nr:putative polyprotein [Albugo laibachii Nc14]|eukprot:CCA24283.1 putative polyprotein [Albugo laibachii Nc14]